MFHCQGHEQEDYVISIDFAGDDTFEDVIKDEWLVDFMGCVECMKAGVIGLLLASNYVGLPVLTRICVLKIMLNLKGKSKQDAKQFLQEKGIVKGTPNIPWGYSELDEIFTAWIDIWCEQSSKPAHSLPCCLA